MKNQVWIQHTSILWVNIKWNKISRGWAFSPLFLISNNSSPELELFVSIPASSQLKAMTIPLPAGTFGELRTHSRAARAAHQRCSLSWGIKSTPPCFPQPWSNLGHLPEGKQELFPPSHGSNLDLHAARSRVWLFWIFCSLCCIHFNALYQWFFLPALLYLILVTERRCQESWHIAVPAAGENLTIQFPPVPGPFYTNFLCRKTWNKSNKSCGRRVCAVHSLHEQGVHKSGRIQ